MSSTKLSRSFLWMALPGAVVLVLLVYLGLEVHRHLTSSPRFAVQQVKVLTEGNADPTQILQRAEIKKGSNIFLLDLGSIQKRVEQDPWVASATVTRALPDTVEIRYEQQKPVAILGMESLYYVNANGVPFIKVDSGLSLDYPLIHVDGSVKASELKPEKIVHAIELLAELEKHSMIRKEDLGDLTLRGSQYGDAAPWLLTAAYPPRAWVEEQEKGKKAAKGLQKKSDKDLYKKRYFHLIFGQEERVSQIMRLNAVLRYLLQQGKNPRLIRLELGKKVVVKVE